MRVLILFLCSLVLTACTPKLDPQMMAIQKEQRTFWKWNDQQIHYVEKGEGTRNVVLVHGFSSDTSTWNDLMNRLVDSGHHVWAIDLLGFGWSDKPLDAKYGIDLYLDQIVSFLEAKGIAKADFVGHSMGGGLVLGMAVYHPEYVERLVVLDPLAYPLDLPFSFLVVKHCPGLIKPFCGPTFIKMARQQLVYKDSTACSPERIDQASMPFMMPNGPDAAFTVLGKFDKQVLTDLSSRIPEIKIPTLIIWGKEDPLIPVAHCENFRRDIPQGQQFILGECGHLPHEEHPEAVENSIIDFLK